MTDLRAKLEEIVTHAKLNYGFHMGPEADKANTKYEVDQILKLIGESLPKEKYTLEEVREKNKGLGNPMEEWAYYESRGWLKCIEDIKKSLGVGG